MTYLLDVFTKYSLGALSALIELLMLY